MYSSHQVDLLVDMGFQWWCFQMLEVDAQLGHVLEEGAHCYTQQEQ